MFRKNPLIELELAYLRQNNPHRRWHYFLLALALLVASLPLFHAFTRQDQSLILTMAFVILAVYWFFQWRIMETAVASIHHELPDEMLGNFSKSEILLAKLWAILRYYQGFIVLISIAALGLSLAMTGYAHRLTSGTGGPMQESKFLPYPITYVAIHPLSTSWDYSNSATLPHPAQLVITFAILLLGNTANSILTVAVNFLSSKRGLYFRLIVLALLFGIFSGFFYARNVFSTSAFQPSDYCINSYGPYDANSAFCQSVIQERSFRQIVESLQVISFSYIDGGIVAATSLLKNVHSSESSIFSPYFTNKGFMWRHLLALSLTIFSQLSLSAFLVWRAGRNMGKKK